MRVQVRQHPRSGFTLVELLVVITIVLLASLVAIPTLVTNLNGRQVTDAARIFSGGLVGARDAAIKYNEPRGIRLLPDPALTIPAPGVTEISGTTKVFPGEKQLVYNRYIPIEPAGDYSEGKVTVGPIPAVTTLFPPVNPRDGGVYPIPDSVTANVNVLMIEESRFVGGFATATAEPNSPTNWYWNIRVGDKIKIGGTGRAYTIVGPCTVNPWNDLGSGIGNPELFVNVGPPGAASPLLRTYYGQGTSPTGTPTFTPLAAALQSTTPEFLLVVNGEDDDADGYVDEGWDGYDNDADVLGDGTPLIDERDEWETEKWLGSLSSAPIIDAGVGPNSPTLAWITQNFQDNARDLPYLIERRPVPTQGAREVMLPAGMVIDATTWNTTQERSRIPVSPGSLYCDILVNPSGLYIPTTTYSSPTSAVPSPFLHFWITDRGDLYPRGALWGQTGILPNRNPSDTANQRFYELPMPSGTTGFTASATVLKNDRRLVTMFTQSGLVVTNTIESIPSPSLYQPGEGFNVLDVGFPFYKAQLGLREAR